MKKLSIIIVAILCTNACTKNEVSFNDLVEIRESRDFIIANAQDTITYVLKFNNEATISLIKAKAEVTNGIFIDNDENELVIEPIRNVEDEIEVIVQVRSTTRASPMEVEFNINEYKTRYIVTSQKSIPSNINIEASAFSVGNSYESEVTLTGSLSSEIGRKVSDGYQVVIKDTFEDGTPVNGVYRASALITNNGLISVVYSPGNISPNQFITIEAIVIDENGLETDIVNQLQLYITATD
ncbi:hypothetical protein [uncultured Winogradskyella sp.]|uniref:hypothetical protein n=1 Tax=uncultured Winogradskyella sp. TaxID=395353 RepID=UPI002625A9DF|nr:hypothetical protein [uncultured Winogradskyella sp.]